MPESVVYWTCLAGVPVYYGGRQIRHSRGSLLEHFYRDLGRAIAEIGRYCPRGMPSRIHTVGIRGDQRSGRRHREGRAFDLAALEWTHPEPHHLRAPGAVHSPAEYLAVEACLRMHLGQVLDYWYDEPHRSHWHIDDKHPPGWRAVRSCNVFVQSSLRHVHLQDIGEIDGAWGPRTAGGWENVVSDLGDGELCRCGRPWRLFLEHTASVGFAAAVN